MVKRNLARKILMSVLTGAVLMSSNVVWAANDFVTSAPSDTDGIWKNRIVSGIIYYPANQDDNYKIHFDNTINADKNFASAFYDGNVQKSNVEASNGYIKIDGGNYKVSNIYGGRCYADSEEKEFSSNNNFVEISGGVFENQLSKNEENGEDVENKQIIIFASSVQYGMRGQINSDDQEDYNQVKVADMKCQTNNNHVVLSGGRFGQESIIIRGVESVAGTDKFISGKITANNNTVDIKDAIFSNGKSYYVHGAFVTAGNCEVEASNNSVKVDNIDFKEGSMIIICGASSNINDFNNARLENNSVSISGVKNFNNAHLIGAVVNNKSYFGGNNTLNLGTSGESGKMWSGKVASIRGFDVINFERIDWKKDSTDGDDAVVKVVKMENDMSVPFESGIVELKNTQIRVNTVFVAGGTTLSNGDKMTLIKADAMTGNIDGGVGVDGIVTGSERAVIYQGVAEAVTVNAEVKQDNNAKKIYLELTDLPGDVEVTEDSTVSPSGGVPSGSSRNDQVLVIGESRAAATAFTNQGSELIETGLDTLARDKSEADTKVFASVYGNTSEYATGSHVKVNGWSGIVGVGKTNANGLTMGAFFENGEGNFRTYNDVNGMFMRGDGEACYNGGGFFVRKDNANGVYTEASLRAGNLQNELRNAVIGSEGLTGYDVDTFYYGAHVGVGKIIPRGNDGDSLDVYGKFIYTHHDSEDFTIDGSDFHFDSIDSERLRLGFRLNEVQNDRLTMYYGAAWEYEFNGDSLDKAASFDLETPTLDGSTVIGEVGVHYKASEKWSLDLNARAYGGQREGFSGSLQANYNF